MWRRYYLMLMGFLFCTHFGISQIKIGTDELPAHHNAIFEVKSDSLGIMLPKIKEENLARIHESKGLIAMRDLDGKLIYYSNVGFETLASNGFNGNILLGDSAGYNLTTGINNIIIGKKSHVYRPTNSNQLTIGNIIYGTGLSDNGTSIGNGSIGIGLNNPSSKLHVKGTVTAEKYNITTGSNSAIGSVNLINGEAVVSNNRITNNSIILLSPQSNLNGTVYLSSKDPGNGFVIRSTSLNDDAIVAYFILN